MTAAAGPALHLGASALLTHGVLDSMAGVRPEIVTGDCVTIGRRRCPVMQVGEVITGQDRRDCSGGEVTRAMARLGFTCHARPEAAPIPDAGARSPLQAASEALGSPGLQDA
ncbi:SCO5918 family protein [Streptomyces guryensis]|uniref:SCO5918 family protein n=1 Tax=Streptomyces guryensis TaxID=2886947 RepID=A0A9Q3VTY0_9ACTN|nr:SCO5918 family protein [Streptomyces guryensis]MCD9879948.1 SCO5918 family protein [Streptomyces guryensis]